MLWAFLESFSFSLLMASDEKIFACLFSQIFWFCKLGPKEVVKFHNCIFLTQANWGVATVSLQKVPEVLVTVVVLSLVFKLKQNFIMKTRLFKYIEHFTSKNWKFSDKKNSDIFHISVQNIDCGYSLEPPRWGSSNEYPQSMFLAEIRKIMYTPVNPSFTI